MFYLLRSRNDGEGGSAVLVNRMDLSAKERKKYDELLERNQFNQYVSDRISVKRSLPSPSRACRAEKYEADLPDTSIIICFHNEAWSTLLRTVHSVLDRSPAHLVKEILLVDDFSDMDHLKELLDDYMAQFPKVKIIRLKQREGLIRARLKGTTVASGTVLTFLDSHVECMEGWLEPLLARISQSPSNVVAPVIDLISTETFKYSLSQVLIGGFDWNLNFRWFTASERVLAERKSKIDPIPTPTIAGGLFAIDKKFFHKIGTYDPGFETWGAENLELSFKTWMCGGRLEVIPCSRVGHIFRKKSPYKWPQGTSVIGRNNLRLAAVWMDEYKQYYHERVNSQAPFGDVSDREDLRKHLQCHSFKWYMNTIFPEQFVPGEAIAEGQIRSKAITVNGPQCLNAAAADDGLLQLSSCNDNMHWYLSKRGEIRLFDFCVEFGNSPLPRLAALIYEKLRMQTCHLRKDNQEWKYDHNTGLIQNVPTGWCLMVTKDSGVKMGYCDEKDPLQKWEFSSLHQNRASQGLL
ncbi:hypothetical protein QR680_007771 [Steinernema hermaphroditum]|uniref:Polypeptide N-acetylgalactosaminyltransferase n=1 Tax=Steinernema hermaphroditum TaxID=289476 RepID=A0AA39IE72_9BILA|nr:hypothetical protein QR680_007771 [Steinernema hermaphroditum]